MLKISYQSLSFSRWYDATPSVSIYWLTATEKDHDWKACWQMWNINVSSSALMYVTIDTCNSSFFSEGNHHVTKADKNLRLLLLLCVTDVLIVTSRAPGSFIMHLFSDLYAFSVPFAYDCTCTLTSSTSAEVPKTADQNYFLRGEEISNPSWYQCLHGSPHLWLLNGKPCSQ